MTWAVLNIHTGEDRNITLLPVRQMKTEADLMCQSYNNLF